MRAPDWTRTPLSLPNGEVSITSEDLDHVDHDHEELFRELLNREDTLVLPLHEGNVLVDDEGRLALLEHPQLPPGAFNPDTLKLYLGRVQPAEGIVGDDILVAGNSAHQRVPVVAVVLEAQEAQEIRVGQWESLRMVSVHMDPRDTGLATRAVALANWHRSHQFSPRTGHETAPVRGGWVREDPRDGSEHFPRTDPAVIIAVNDSEDRLLLASNTAWDERVFSLIAGFVDPGETLEGAVVREVREESGLHVTNPVYLGSQPWPFPASLMLGFQATLEDSIGHQRPDGIEIRALRWFTRAELSAAVGNGEVILPGHASIARAIISSWHGGSGISS